MVDPIESVVNAFYKKATTDILIGYHFRKIAQQEAREDGGNHPLKPPLEAFSHHLPRISIFWKSQLLGEKIPAEQSPFDLIGVHKNLLIRKGELHRWLTLFRETLNEETDLDFNLKENWLKKLDHFEGIFLTSPHLFKGPRP